MSVTEPEELQAAAAAGAAAAVDAVIDEQTREAAERAMAEQTAVAEVVAQDAQQQAQTAAEASTAAVDAAVTAIDESQAARLEAETAAEVAFDAKAEIDLIRDEVRAMFDDFRSQLDARLAPPQTTNEPTEVVVTNEPATTGNASSDSGQPSGGSERQRRSHRFGRRRD